MSNQFTDRLGSWFSKSKDQSEASPESREGVSLRSYTLTELISFLPSNPLVSIVGRELEAINGVLARSFVPTAAASGKSVTIAPARHARTMYGNLKAAMDNESTPDVKVHLFNPSERVPKEVQDDIEKGESQETPAGHFILYFPDDLFDSKDNEAIERWVTRLNHFLIPYLHDRLMLDDEVEAELIKNQKATPVYLAGLEGYRGDLLGKLLIHLVQARPLGISPMVNVSSLASERLMRQCAPLLANSRVLVFPDKDTIARGAELFTAYEALQGFDSDTASAFPNPASIDRWSGIYQAIAVFAGHKRPMELVNIED